MALAAPVLTMMSFSLWRHSLLSWPHPPLRAYVCTQMYKDDCPAAYPAYLPPGAGFIFAAMPPLVVKWVISEVRWGATYVRQGDHQVEHWPTFYLKIYWFKSFGGWFWFKSFWSHWLWFDLWIIFSWVIYNFDLNKKKLSDQLQHWSQLAYGDTAIGDMWPWVAPL